MAARSRIRRNNASAALDFFADHRADFPTLVHAQLDGAVKAQFTLHHAGRADVHFGLFFPAPAPVRSLVLPDVDAAAHMCAVRELDVAIAGDEFSTHVGAPEFEIAGHRGDVAAHACAGGQFDVPVHG